MRIQKLFLPIAVLVILAATSGNDSGSCGFADGNGGAAVECTTAAECDGQDTTHQCTGFWQCISGRCEWECKTECSSDADCKDGKHCIKGLCASSCIQSGCSGEVCASEPVFTDCVIRDWYRCLSLTKCGEYGPNGACGFEENDAFEKCVSGATCHSDSDCPSGYYCALDTYCGYEAQAGEPVYCSGQCTKKGTKQCYSDTDCPKGEVCYLPPCAPCECDPKEPGCTCPLCGPGQCGPAQCTDNDKDGVCEPLDCDDNDASIFPGAEEICDGRDNDCNGIVDDPCSKQCLTDADCGTGYVCVLPRSYNSSGEMVCCPYNAKCTPEIPPCGAGYCKLAPGYCFTDDDCEPQYHCENTVNCLPDTNCLGPYKCVMDTCVSDKDCPYGYHCAQPGLDKCCSGAYCDPKWPMCGTCIPNNGECTSDEDCGEGFVCDFSMTDTTECCMPGQVCLLIYPPCKGWCKESPPSCIASKQGSHGACEMVLGYIFDGTKCVLESGCSCKKGIECWDSIKTCEAACGVQISCTFDSDCGIGEYCDHSTWADMAGCCVPLDPSGSGCPPGYPICPGVCRLKPGLCWSDADCSPHMHCEGAIICPPGALCLIADQPGKCVPNASCTIVKPGTHGMCAMFLGYIFDGASCVGESGCSCGAECAFFFSTIEECENACPVKPSDCTSDSDCGPGQYCKFLCGNGWCSGSCAPVPAGTCVKDADCGPFGTCKKEVCPLCVGCPCFGKCEHGDALPCSSNADCPKGMACKQFTECPPCVYMNPPCLVPCTSYQVCLAPCWSDVDCPSGFFCDVKKCEGGTKCVGPYECVPIPTG